MTRQEYWNAHVVKNPKLAIEDSMVSVKVSTLKKLIEEAYDKGFEHRGKINDKLASVIGNLGRVIK
jgi:hypothetical protein